MDKTLAANYKRILLSLFMTFLAEGFIYAQNTEISTVLNSTGICQLVTCKTYSMTNGFCSTSLFINSDSTFTFESGCEGRSHVTIGIYKISNDSLHLFPIKKSEIQPICNLELIGSTTQDTLVTFVIKDKLGESLNSLLKPRGKDMDIYDPVMLDILVNSWRDSLSINKQLIDTLEFPALALLTGKSYIFSTKSLPSVVNITVNVNVAALHYDEITYTENIPKSWLIKKRQIVASDITLELRK